MYGAGDAAAGWPAAVALMVAAACGAAATIYTARRTAPPRPPAPPPASADDDDNRNELITQLWRETLARLDELGLEADTWRKRAERAEAENLDLLRRLARGDGSP